MKCKPYSEITVEIWTQLKTVKITSNIFAVCLKIIKWTFLPTHQNKTSCIISSDVEGLSSLSENQVLKQVIIAYWLSNKYGYEIELLQFH